MDTKNRGEVYSAPTAGQVTGKGAGVLGSTGAQGGVLVMDDPLKSADALYPNKRNHVNDLFWEVAKNRLNGQQTPIILIMQRLHEDDLTGHILEAMPGRFHHLKIPVYREDGNVLWPAMYSKEEAELDSKSRPQYFAGQYLQEPAPLEGGIWKKDWFIEVGKHEVPEGIKWELFLDGAYTKDTKNDPSGILIGGVDRDTKTVYIKHREAVRMEMPRLIKHIQNLVDVHDVSIVLAEPKAIGLTAVQLLREAGVPARKIKSRWAAKNKDEKANDCAPKIAGGKVFIVKGSWNAEYLHQVSTFPNGKHDEDVDNTAYLIERYLLRKQVKVY